MKISYLILFLGCILSSTDYKFYDITFNKEYIVDITQWREGYLPGNFNYYFRLQAIPSDDLQIQLTVLINAVIDFQVDICGFYDCPSDDSALSGYGGSCANSLQGVITDDGYKYKTYSYPFSTTENVNYLTIHMQNKLALHYLSVYVYSKTGKQLSAAGLALGILLLIIFLPCIIVVAVVVFILRRCGCITIGTSSAYI